MSALVVIVCDLCGDHGSVAQTPQEARNEMNSWTRKNGLDLCPLCRLLTESRARMAGLSTQPPTMPDH